VENFSLKGRERINIKRINACFMFELAYAQLPDGRTLLHCLYNSDTVLDYFFREVEQAKGPNLETLYLPIFNDLDGHSALELIL
jgi:hypothetical protein